jgi:hypothetical protein
MRYLLIVLPIALVLGCLKVEKYPKTLDGIEVDGPPELFAMVEAAWPAFNEHLGINPPWLVQSVTAERAERATGVPCAGWYANGVVHVVPPYAALPHELAHHAGDKLHGPNGYSHNNWPPEILEALYAAATVIGMGHE